MKRVGIAVVLLGTFLAVGCGGADDTQAESADSDLTRVSADPGQPGAPIVTAQGVTVVGTGSAKAVPDVAEWSFGVRSEGESARGAMTANAGAMQQVLDALKAAGIARDDLRTEQVSLYPQTDETGREVHGYTASNTVHVTVRDMSRTGAIVDAAVQAGANEIYGPSLVVSESDAQYAQAIDAAYDDARKRAEAVAAKAGVVLGGPIAIVEGVGGGGVIAYRAMEAAADLAVPIEPGSQQIQATLTVTFAIS